MDRKNIENLVISADANRHLRPRLCIELMRAWREAERQSHHELRWKELVELFHAHAPHPCALEMKKSRDAILSAAEIDKIAAPMKLALDARPIVKLYPSKRAHEAMRTALFEPRMASGGKVLYELFFRYLDLSESAGSVKRTYARMLRVIEPAVANWPLGEKLATQILEAGLKQDGLTFAQLKDGIRNEARTYADARLEASAGAHAKFLFILPTHRHSHA
ncbi:MAG: hypothetical protein M3N08_07475 [Pseudomonadota bacterium]|nr:hypothetical protein [Pseudomonadota bacterium]